MEPKFNNPFSILPNMEMLRDINIPSENTATACAECPTHYNLTYCMRCCAKFCNHHILTHIDHFICIGCGKDTCVEMMGDDDKLCFRCSIKPQITRLKDATDDLYDLKRASDDLYDKASALASCAMSDEHMPDIQRLTKEINMMYNADLNKEINMMYNAVHYGSAYNPNKL